MSKRLAFLHTSAAHHETFTQLARELLPGVETYNIVDESLLQNTIRAGHLEPGTAKRVVQLLTGAEDAGADAVLVTCSSLGAAVEAARPFVNIPILRVDQPMADEAVRLGHTIGVIATLSTTLEPTAELVRARAVAAGKPDVKIINRLCEGAFEARFSGRVAEHDRMVAAALTELAAQCDVIVLAQASMAHVVDQLPEDTRRVPILSSPRRGVAAAAGLFTADPSTP